MPVSKSEDISYRILFDGDREEHDVESTTSPATGFGSLESFGKSFHLPPQSTVLPYTETRCSRRDNLLTWLRWSFVVILQFIILLLLARPSPATDNNCVLSGSEGPVETGDDINGLYKTCMCIRLLLYFSNKANVVSILDSHTYTFLKPEEEKYVPNMTSNDNRMEVRRNWDLLMPRTSFFPQLIL